MDTLMATFTDLYAQQPVAALVGAAVAASMGLVQAKRWKDGETSGSSRPKRSTASKSAAAPAATPKRVSRRISGVKASPVRRPASPRAADAREKLSSPFSADPSRRVSFRRSARVGEEVAGQEVRQEGALERPIPFARSPRRRGDRTAFRRTVST